MSLLRLRVVILCSWMPSLIAGCGSSSSSGSAGAGQGGAGQGGAITGAGSSHATSTSSASSGASTSSGSSEGGAGGQGGQGGADCTNTDPGEPNDTEGAAYDLGPLGCADSKAGQVHGVLARPDDVDWFVYDGKDGALCEVNPTSGVTVTTGVARVCAYFECVSGADKTEIKNCPNGTNTDTSPDGRPGCCGTTTFTVSVNCKGTIDDESRVFLRVDDPTHTGCTEYTLAFHY